MTADREKLESCIMGAARLHTHDHTMAYAITKEVMASIAALSQSPLPGEGWRADLINAVRRSFEGALKVGAPGLHEPARNAVMLSAMVRFKKEYESLVTASSQPPHAGEGLKEQVRDPKESFSAFTVLKETFFDPATHPADRGAGGASRNDVLEEAATAVENHPNSTYCEYGGDCRRPDVAAVIRSLKSQG